MQQYSCRICLSDDSNTLSSLFELQDGSSYAEQLMFIEPNLKILPSDVLPKNICLNCIDLLGNAYNFKQKYRETDSVLRRTIQIAKHLKNPLEILQIESTSLKKSTAAVEIYSAIEEHLHEEPRKKSEKPKDVTRNKNKKPEADDYRCFICQQVFDLISAKDAHVKKHHKNETICKICSKRKQTAISLENHLRFHEFGYRFHNFLCSICGKSFRFKNLLENHLKVEHLNAVTFQCDLCQYHTKFKINVERHIKSVHMKLKNFKCIHCADHEYSTQVGLNLHLYRCHATPAPVTCSDCLQGFTFESELRVHKKHCTGNTVRQHKARPQDAPVDISESGFRCRICQKVYKTRSKWSVHFHHKHKNSNVCIICNKQMASSTSLFKHIQVQHKNIKKFQCEICNKTFGFKHSLESHKNTHTGEKPFSCNLCNFRSGDRSTISKHKKKIHMKKETVTNE